MSIIKTIFQVSPDRDPAIISSRIISQAKSVNQDGTVTIIAVFERSTYQKFFHVFTAASKRAPRKTWKYTNQYYSIYSGIGSDPYYTLRSLLASRHPYSGRTWTIRHHHGARTLADLTKRIAHPVSGYIAPVRIHIQPITIR